MLPVALALFALACAREPDVPREIVRRTFYADGQPWSELHYRSGKPVGVWTTWHPGQRKASQGEYRDGQQQGRWQRWYASGALAMDANYVGGLLDGEYLESWPDGTKKSEGAYVRGKPEGHWVEWSRGARKTVEGAYKDGERQGVWTVWYGQDDEQGHKAGELRGHAVYEKGVLVTDKEKRKAALEAAGWK